MEREFERRLASIQHVLSKKAKAINRYATVNIVLYPSAIIVELLDEVGRDWYIGEYDRDKYEKEGCDAFLNQLLFDLKHFDFMENAAIASTSKAMVFLLIAAEWAKFAKNLNIEDFETTER